MKNKICKTLLAIGMLCISVAILPLRVYAEKYEYDEFDRVVKVEYDDGSYVTYNYDKNGNIVDTFVYDCRLHLTTEERHTIHMIQIAI